MKRVKGKIESRGVGRFFRLEASPEPKLRSYVACASIRRPRVGKGLKRTSGRGEQIETPRDSLLVSPHSSIQQAFVPSKDAAGVQRRPASGFPISLRSQALWRGPPRSGL